jgi:hypothetical protein
MHRYALIMTEDFGRCVIRTGDHELAASSRREFRALKRRIDLVIRNLITAGVEDGSMAPCDVRMTAFAVTGALNWVARWYDPNGLQSPLDIATLMVSVLTRLVARPVKPAPGK